MAAAPPVKELLHLVGLSQDAYLCMSAVGAVGFQTHMPLSCMAGSWASLCVKWLEQMDEIWINQDGSACLLHCIVCT